jgi:hypothetical protein
VNATCLPSSRRSAITVSPSIAPREELPCAVPNPSRSITRRVHCPSKFTVFITTIPRFLQIQIAGKMLRCQNAPIPGSPELRICTAFWTPTISTRSVGPISRTSQYAAHAITGICARLQRESSGSANAEVPLAFKEVFGSPDVVALFTAV